MKDGPLFNFENVECKYAPYPVGYIRGVMPADIYREMATSFPAKELFVYRPGLGKKYSLNERADKQAFSNFVNGSPLWRRVYDEVKSPRFMHDVVEALYRQNVDIGLRNRIAPVNHSLCAAWRRVADAFSCLKRGRVR